MDSDRCDIVPESFSGSGITIILAKEMVLLGASWLNLGSLVLGLIAWILPVVNLVQRNKIDHRNWTILSVASVSACSISLCMQIFYNDHLVKTEDWSALMDTSSAVAMVSTLLLVVTIILNAVAFVVYYGKKSKDR
ncbi:MAG: hypothetical protein QME45_13020 [Clostridiales bacterium]|nr:hypothetical protein [Clostridiales bacterium]